jgi:hypothetical protein
MMDEESLASLIGGEGADTPVAPAEGEEAGRMPAVQEEAGATPAPEPAATAAEAGQVPISEFLEERERRQGLEKRLAEIEAAQRAAKAQAQAGELPPEQRREAELWALRRDMSREMLASKHGEDEAKALEAWGFERCERDPHFNAQVYAARNPYAFIREAKQREELLAEVKPEELQDYRAWKANLLRSASFAGQALQPATQPGAVASPPRSLVTAPNAGGPGAAAQVSVGPGAAFASTIRR